MPQRTIENCTLIQDCIRSGIGNPKTYSDGTCDGYCRGEYDDEPHDTCKECKLCNANEEAQS